MSCILKIELKVLKDYLCYEILAIRKEVLVNVDIKVGGIWSWRQTVLKKAARDNIICLH